MRLLSLLVQLLSLLEQLYSIPVSATIISISATIISVSTDIQLLFKLPRNAHASHQSQEGEVTGENATVLSMKSVYEEIMAMHSVV